MQIKNDFTKDITPDIPRVTLTLGKEIPKREQLKKI
jgi:hypothetical protein